MKARNHALRFRQAIELLHLTDTRLMLMHSRDGDEFTSCPAAVLTRAMR